MQSSSVLPPPPAILGAAWLGLVLEGDDELSVAVPPAARVVCGAIEGASGAMARNRVTGVPTAELGGEAGAAGCAAGVLALLAADRAAGEVRVVLELARELTCALATSATSAEANAAARNIIEAKRM